MDEAARRMFTFENRNSVVLPCCINLYIPRTNSLCKLCNSILCCFVKFRGDDKLRCFVLSVINGVQSKASRFVWVLLFPLCKNVLEVDQLGARAAQTHRIHGDFDLVHFGHDLITQTIVFPGELKGWKQ